MGYSEVRIVPRFPKTSIPIGGNKSCMDRYWNQRYSLFSYYDEGIYLTDDAWFGVTPEPVAS